MRESQADVPQIRVQRRKPARFDDENHSWAISYADMLMVLLSFFVIFFSIEPTQRESVLDSVRLSMAGLNASGKNSAMDVGRGGQEATDIPSSEDFSFESLSQKIRSLDSAVKMQTNSSQLLIELPDNFFRSGSFQTSTKKRNLARKVAGMLLSHPGKFRVTVIGHTDVRRVRKVRGRGFSDNLELSFRRAQYIRRVFLKSGWNPSRIAVKASASTGRANRTVTIEVEEAK